jgi:hypothetical protein
MIHYFPLSDAFRFSKQSKEMKISDEMKQRMPLIFLDGELWLVISIFSLIIFQN